MLEPVVGRPRRDVTSTGVVTARGVERRLYDETCRTIGFDLCGRVCDGWPPRPWSFTASAT